MTSKVKDLNTEKTLLSIPQLDPKIIKTSTNTLIIGNRACGKTELIRHIVSLYEPSTKFYLFTTKFNCPIIKGQYYDEILEGRLNAIIKSNIDKNKIVVIFDDIISKAPTYFHSYLMNSHQHNISNIIAVQSELSLPHDIRSAIMDTVIFFEEKNISSLKRHYDLYFGFIKEFGDYVKLFRDIACRYQVLCTNKNKAYYYNYYLMDKETSFTTESIIYDDTYDNPNKYNYDKKILIKQLLDQNEKILELIKNL